MCALIAIAVLPFTGTSPVPEFEDHDVLVELSGKPGTSNELMTSTATALSDTLTALPGVDGVGAHVGRAITGDRLTNVNSASVWVRIDDDADHAGDIRGYRGGSASRAGRRERSGHLRREADPGRGCADHW